mmetsp:Transcript_38220/g.85972  ORF Transcript_38220/g.85972 Transcript_38220/m.85972 type:complete len:412 (-) Transcript_38220:88-1323(-)
MKTDKYSTSLKKKAKAPADPDRPKRPLSAYNLFYRFKRQVVMDAIASGKTDKDAIVKVATSPAGAEAISDEAMVNTDPDELKKIREKAIREILEGNLGPRDTRDRSHRKNDKAINGQVSFVELAELMKTAWKDIDPHAKSILSELSEQSRADYRKQMDEYNKTKKEMPIELPQSFPPNVSRKGFRHTGKSEHQGGMSNIMGGGEMENVMNRRGNRGLSQNFPGNHGGMNMNMQSFFQGMNFPNMQMNDQQQRHQSQRPFSREELMLAHAVEMEASQMLRARVRELELQLALQKAREDRLRSQIESRFSDSRRGSTNSDTSEGFSSLAFASKLMNGNGGMNGGMNMNGGMPSNMQQGDHQNMNNMMGGFNQPPGSTGLPQNMAASEGETADGDGGISGGRKNKEDAAGKRQG